MQYIKLNEDKWVEVDGVNNTSKIIVKSEIEDQITFLTVQTEGKDVFTDEQKIVWFDANYPQSEEMKEIVKKRKIVSDLQELHSKLI